MKDNVKVRSRQKNYHAGMPFPTTFLIDAKGAKITVGENCRLNGVYLHAEKEISIGKNTVIASGVNIIDSNGHILNSSDRTKGRDVPKAIHIGDNVWIGLNAIILKGTVIGSNSVVAAGSVVKGEFPANSVISGNPATVTDVINIKDYEVS
ncbi:acyltransferase [Flavobacterium sp. LaA7.5]|nr:acyltransferase [Flavobacterium salilacus subsp. altitudinum]